MQDWASDSVCHNVTIQSRRRGAIAAIASSSRGFVDDDTGSPGSNDIWHVTCLCIITGVASLLCDRRSRFLLTLASIAFFGIEGTEEERVEFGHTSKQ
jgi:hypothetical protein